MAFDCDAANAGHIARLGITPEECEEAYRNGPIVIERRRLCLGETNKGKTGDLCRDGTQGQDPGNECHDCQFLSAGDALKLTEENAIAEALQAT